MSNLGTVCHTGFDCLWISQFAASGDACRQAPAHISTQSGIVPFGRLKITTLLPSVFRRFFQFFKTDPQ